MDLSFLLLNKIKKKINIYFLYKILIKYIKIFYKIFRGLGIGDWGLGIGDWAQYPNPHPQSPNPNHPSPIPITIT